MRNTREENLCEHSFDVSVLAHALAVISNTRFGTSYNPERAAALSLFHDAPEIITGDLPTPVKYYNPELRSQYARLEKDASEKLLNSLPQDLRPSFEPFFFEKAQDKELWRLIKAADKLSALTKCIQEASMGNTEFRRAALSIRKSLAEMELPAVDVFLSEFMPSFSLSLDEQEL